MNCKKKIDLIYLLVLGVFILVMLSHSYAAENISDSILSVAEQSQCLERSQQANQSASQLIEQSDKLAQLKNNRDALQQNLQVKRTQLNWHSRKSVEEYNQINKSLNQLSLEYQEKVDSFNRDVKQYQIDIEMLKAECDDKQYYK